MKKVLLIEDNLNHGEKTKKIIEQMPDMFKVDLLYFDFMKQNGDLREDQLNRIKGAIEKEIINDTFDVLMIDLLLGGDDNDPIGFEIIKFFSNQLEHKKVIVYTEMSNNNLDAVKAYNCTLENKISIIPKPNSFVNLKMTDVCEIKNREIKKQLEIPCNLNSCNAETKLKCSMECIYYSI